MDVFDWTIFKVVSKVDMEHAENVGTKTRRQWVRTPGLRSSGFFAGYVFRVKRMITTPQMEAINGGLMDGGVIAWKSGHENESGL